MKLLSRHVMQAALLGVLVLWAFTGQAEAQPTSPTTVPNLSDNRVTADTLTLCRDNLAVVRVRLEFVQGAGAVILEPRFHDPRKYPKPVKTTLAVGMYDQLEVETVYDTLPPHQQFDLLIYRPRDPVNPIRTLKVPYAGFNCKPAADLMVPVHLTATADFQSDANEQTGPIPHQRDLIGAAPQGNEIKTVVVEQTGMVSIVIYMASGALLATLLWLLVWGILRPASRTTRQGGRHG